MKKQIPNFISAIRIVLAPIVLYSVYRGQFVLATFLYLLGLFTDLLDGYVARKLGVISQFGINFDPFCSAILFYVTSLGLYLWGGLSFLYPLLIALFSILNVILQRITQRKEVKRILILSAIAVGGGLGDFGLGIYMSWKYLGQYAYMVIVVATLFAIYKNRRIFTKKFLLDKYGEI